MPLRNVVWLLVVPGLIGLGLAIGSAAPAPDKDYRLVRQIIEVLAEVDANYVRELSDADRQKLVEDMINGGLHNLDPHSEYLNAEQLKRFETDNQGSFGGVGINITTDAKTKLLKVEFPMAGTPAYEAGVVAGDLIVKVGDISTENMKVEEARKRITGELGTEVTLTIRREGHNPPEFPVTLTRSKIAIHPVAGVSRRTDDPTKWNWFADPAEKIALVRISQFNDLTADEVRSAIAEIEAAGGKALVIDLRENPGGLLSQAIEVSDLFLTEGKIVTTKDRRGGEKTSTAKEKGTVFLPTATRPMAILVDGNSASASEIVAAALQDNKRAVVVGERTYGKGSVQSLFRLPPDQKTAVKLTTQTWWRPSGKNMDKKYAEKQRIDEWGVTPDDGLSVIPTRDERLRYEVEMQKLNYVAGKPSVVGPNPPPMPPFLGPDGKPIVDESKPFEDRALNRALEYLRKKLSGVGTAPARGGPIPVRVAA